MPQELSCVGWCADFPASINTTDKSNNTSLLSRTKAHTPQMTNGRNSHCNSEKDSGYSDAGSDYQQTDVDDQHSTITELRCHKPDSMADQGNHILVSGQTEFTSMFIIKKIVLKQSGQDQVPQSLWGSEGTNAQSNLLLLQQPGTVSPLHVHTPQPERAETVLLPTSKVNLSGGSVPDSTNGLTRHRRFLNTVEILSQSGLLDITLRTQELLCQSAAIEQNIAQLRQHTQMLCQAVYADSNVATLEKTHRVMVESGCYPNLRSLLFMGTDD
ncbi:hypothetical protein AMELA_G00270300 [Ameiurus melas]|uniref:Uncharacterized protein n=1 Tax=Ameiurus melas TaxID=219545 RepID=A0A7J5ZR20_AMEME|nr:hypothetical protein AMELA_G00270300 [Ameiurus melas]